MTCFPEVQDTCDANPPSDTTRSIRGFGAAFSSAGGLLIPAFATTGTVYVDLNPGGNEDVQSFGGTNIATFADTGSVSVVRSGYGTVSIGSVTRLARADTDPARLTNGPAFLSIATDGGVNILVTDSQGRRIGFQPGGSSATVPTLPGVPTPQLGVPPSVATEIFGASYSGTPSQPQLITIPNPTPGDYQITATAASDPPFTVTVEALDINNQVIDRFTESGTVGAGTPTTLTARLDASGHVSSPGAPGSDTTAPTTTAALAPAPNNAGWNNGDLVVTLTSTDDPGGSGVKQIAYSATGAESIPATNVAGALANITLTAEGATTVTFSATDNAGNQETPGSVVVQIDKTPPTITSARAPQANQYGWNNSPVTISFACSDSLSGLAAGSPPASTTLSAEGANQSVSGTCTDVAGNAASTSVQNIAIDLTAPTIAITANAPTLWPPTGKPVPDTISGGIADALSGVDPASLSFQVIDSYGLVQPTGAVTVGSDGTFSFTLTLDASREGTELTGRQYQIVVSGRDKAGNTASASTIVTVPHDQR